MAKKMYASNLINVAMKEVGYLEKRSPKYLYSKTKNAGYNNYTKYGKAYGMNGVYWCCEFAWWCHYKAFGSAYTKDETIKTASCEVMRQHFKNKGRFNQIPKKGDFIFFETTTRGRANHIGIVYKVSGNTVYTIEGNTNAGAGIEPNGGGVAKKSYLRNNPKILGYGHPKYDKKPLTAPAAPLEYKAEGAAVKKLQKCLNKVLHINLTLDGEYGSKTADAVKSFKVKYKISNKNGKHYGKLMKKELNRQLKKVQK